MNLMFFMLSLFHSITPILFRMRSTHPVTRLLFCDYNISFDASQQFILEKSGEYAVFYKVFFFFTYIKYSEILK